MNEECLIYKEPLNTSTPTKKWNVCFAITQAVKFTSENAYRYEDERCDLHSLALEQSIQTGKTSFPQKLYKVLNSNFAM